MFNSVKRDLAKQKNSAKAKILARFFKTGKGEYGEGDVFLGVSVPKQRKTAKKYIDANLRDVERLLQSKIHEHRLTALLIVVAKYQRADDGDKKEIVNFYLRNTRWINNWDLVDLSAEKILGAHLIDKDKSLLYKLAKSNNLWERRIAILSTFYFIKNNQFADALKISEILLNDGHDLIHKAAGWMLREIGKRDQEITEKFLSKHCQKMPRTMLRYAIEKYPGSKRKLYLAFRK